MKWIVGLDLRPLSHGAIHFASWLATHSREPQELIGIHVIEERILLAALRYNHLDEVIGAAREEARGVLRALGTLDHFAAVEVVAGGRAEVALEAARVDNGADALIIGRHAKSDGISLVRLGRVARRLINTLPAPVVVVPPDLQAADIGLGPIVGLTHLTPESAVALEWAHRLSEPLEVPLWAVYCAHGAEDLQVPYLTPHAIVGGTAEGLEEGRLKLASWLSEHQYGWAHGHTLSGEPVRQAINLAGEAKPTLIVVGSRQLGRFERWFSARVGSELAAMATAPVAVVPPPSEA